MGEIRKINHYTGEDMGSAGEFNGNCFGKPFICVYEEVAPKVASGHLATFDLVGDLKAYIRYTSSDELNAFLAKDSASTGTIGGTMVVTEELCEHLGKTPDSLFAEAISNMIETGIAIKDASEIVGMPTMGFMYVAHYNDFGGQRGAGILAIPCLLEKIREKIGDCYIIPSSVHEIIAVPESAPVPAEELREMIVSVNKTCLLPEDILSNRLYKLDETGLHLA